MDAVLALGVPQWVESLGEWWFSGLMGIILYWIPLATCAVVYTVKGVQIYFKLRKERVGEAGKTSPWFNPDELTVGHIIGFAFITVCPGINFIAFICETAWKVLKFIVEKCAWIFNAPLVPDSKKYKEIRQEKAKERAKERADDRNW